MEEERESKLVDPYSCTDPLLDFTASSSVPSSSTMGNILQLPSSAQFSPIQYPETPQMPQLQQIMQLPETSERSRSSLQLDQFMQLQDPLDFTASSSIPSGSTMANLLQLPHSDQPSPMQYSAATQMPQLQQISIGDDMHPDYSQLLDQFMQWQNPLDFTGSSSMPSGSAMANLLQLPQSHQPNPMQYPAAPQMPMPRQITNAKHPETGESSQPSNPLDEFMQLQNTHMDLFWQHQRLQLETLEAYKHHHLPISRIRRIMKMDGDAQMVSAETPVMLAKACEYFIQELAIRSWLHAERSRRQTIKTGDVAAAICCTDMMDFLIDIIPREEMKDHLPLRDHRQQNMAVNIPQSQIQDFMRMNQQYQVPVQQNMATGGIPHGVMQDHLGMGQHQVEQQNVATQIPNEVMQDRLGVAQPQVDEQNMGTHIPLEDLQAYMTMSQQHQLQQQNMDTHGHTFNPRP